MNDNKNYKEIYDYEFGGSYDSFTDEHLKVFNEAENCPGCLVNKLAINKGDIMKCEKCGWELEYISRSFQDQIKEIIGGTK